MYAKQKLAACLKLSVSGINMSVKKFDLLFLFPIPAFLVKFTMF
jgi:hypothetical protein